MPNLTDLKMTGRPSQFGRGMLEVTGALMMACRHRPYVMLGLVALAIVLWLVLR